VSQFVCRRGNLPPRVAFGFAESDLELPDLAVIAECSLVQHFDLSCSAGQVRSLKAKDTPMEWP